MDLREKQVLPKLLRPNGFRSWFWEGSSERTLRWLLARQSWVWKAEIGKEAPCPRDRRDIASWVQCSSTDRRSRSAAGPVVYA